MNTRFSSALSVLFILLAASAATFAQDDTFSDPTVDYTFTLPNEQWKQTARPSATSPNVEYVYGDRNLGHLEVRRLTVDKNSLTTDAIHEEEDKLRFLLGYVGGKEENFAGRLKGVIFNFEFVRAGKQMSGRYYFLRADDTTIYMLRFDGLGDKMRSIQNQTDSIARTFSVKK